MPSIPNPRHSVPADNLSIGRDGAGDFIDETLAIWQRRTTRQLTREDGREIIENMTAFFRILGEWDRAERYARKRIPIRRGRGV